MSARRKREQRNIENPVIGFQEIVSNIEVSRNGRAQWLNDALDVAISEAHTATEQYGKESVLTLTISVKKQEQGKAEVTAKLAEKMAKGVTTGVTIYRNAKGETFFEDPYQPKLDGFDGDDNVNM